METVPKFHSLLTQEGMKAFLNWYHKDFSMEKEIEHLN